MRLFFLGFCLLLSISVSAQSVFDENIISGDELREMVVELFETQNGQTIQQADAEYGQEIVLLVHSKYSARLDQQDVKNAIIDLKSSPAELDLNFPVQIFDEGEMTQAESSRAIRLGVSRIENRLSLNLSRENVSDKKRYVLFAVFEKDNEIWKLSTQNLNIIP